MLDPVDSTQIAGQLNAVRQRIAAAAQRVGRDPRSVRLVAASKTQSPPAIRATYAAGARDFGENYVKEALAKQAELPDLKDITWHLIGHLQTNKAKVAAGAFALIQSLDSVRLADALDRARHDRPMPVLVEVNLGGETSKTGVRTDLEWRIRLKADAKRMTGNWRQPGRDIPQRQSPCYASRKQDCARSPPPDQKRKHAHHSSLCGYCTQYG